MWRVSIWVTASMVVGCGGPTPTPTPPRPTKPVPSPCERDPGSAACTIATVDGFRMTMCACKDLRCAARTDAVVKAWATQSAPHEQPSPEHVRRVDKLTADYTACKDKVRDRSSRPTCVADDTACVLAQLASFTDEICACPDRSCAEAVTGDLQAWSTANTPGHPTASQLEAIQQLRARYTACLVDRVPPSP